MYEPPFNIGDDNARQASENYTKELTSLLAADRRGDAVALTMMTWGVPAEAITGMRQSPIRSNFESVAPTLAYDNTIMEDGLVPVKLLNSIIVPVLVIDGGTSPPFMHNSAKAVKDGLSNAQYHTLKGQTHDVDPEVLAPVLVEFFSDS